MMVARLIPTEATLVNIFDISEQTGLTRAEVRSELILLGFVPSPGRIDGRWERKSLVESRERARQKLASEPTSSFPLTL